MRCGVRDRVGRKCRQSKAMALSRRSIFSARPLARFSLPAQLSAAALPRRIAPPVNRRRAIPDRRDVNRQLSDVNGLIRYATAGDRTDIVAGAGQKSQREFFATGDDALINLSASWARVG